MLTPMFHRQRTSLPAKEARFHNITYLNFSSTRLRNQVCVPRITLPLLILAGLMAVALLLSTRLKESGALDRSPQATSNGQPFGFL